jgi:TRAP-type C4-dicarboxylate transport system substrate-binding protein
MKNKLRNLVPLLLGCLAFLAVDGTHLRAQATRTISLATLAPPGSTWARVFDAWNREIRTRSGGSLQLRVYGGGVQGDEAEVIRKIRSGRLDAGAVTAVGLAQIHRPALVFQMPGILRTYAQLDHARDALAPDMDAGFTSGGFHLLGWADVGQARIFSTQATVQPSDFASRHPFVWRDDLVLPTLYEQIHTNPVPLQLPEVLGAIQTGRVDTAIVPPVAALALQWSTRLNHMTDLPLTIVLGGTVMGNTQWTALTEEQRTIMTETGAQFHTLARRNLRRDETTALHSLTEHGVTVDAVTPAQQAEWLALGGRIRTALAGQVADQALIDRVAAFGH